MAPVELIGIAATCLTTPSFIPQAVKIIRTRDTKAISLWMYSMLATGQALWIVYGVSIGSPGLIIGNSIAIVFVLTILMLKIKHG